MKKLTLAFLAAAVVCLGSDIPKRAKIYIEPNDGFETYLMAAIQKKHVPVTVVADKAQAEYTIESTEQSQKPGWAKTIFVSPHSQEDASIRLTKIGSSEIVWAYSVHKFSSVHGKQSTAEACAKHLKSIVK